MNFLTSIINNPRDFLIGLLWLLILSFLLREVLAWYWKINRIIKLLEKIEQNTTIKNAVEESVKK
jgi:hypothetical protein